MKKHIKNKKTISAIVVSAAVLSVGSVGFASWVISGGTASSTMANAIGVEVAAVKDERIQMSTPTFYNTCTLSNNATSDAQGHPLTLVDGGTPPKAYLVFGPKSNDNTGYIQAGKTGDDGVVSDYEHLTVAFQFTLTSPQLKTTLNTITITPTYPAILNTLADSNKEYIENPSSGNTEVTLYSTQSGGNGASNQYTAEQTYVTGTGGSFVLKISAFADNKVTVTISANWVWGEVFGGDNPSTLDSNDSQVNSVVTQLNSLYSLVSATAADSRNVSFIVKATTK